MKYYKIMYWGDVIRMNGDFKFPVNSYDHLELAPSKEDFKVKGYPSLLYNAFVNSFRASSKKFSSRKWIVDYIKATVGLPSDIANTKQIKTRWNIDFIKVEEPVEEIVEEIKEEEILETDKGV